MLQNVNCFEFIATLDDILMDERFCYHAEVARKAACNLKEWIAAKKTTEIDTSFLSDCTDTSQ